jgi:predicted CoA-binding protein
LNKDNLKLILDEVETIAVVGASSNPDRDSYKVMKFLKDFGYEVFPVNPNLVNTKILGQECYPSLAAIEKKIDMVDIFRAAEFIPDITKEVIKIQAKILWTQLGIVSKEAASLGKNAGLLVVMDECPKIILENSDCTN